MSDRLGGLPDDVISHILSFLPLKSSAQTSLLSKTWRFLWAHVQFLEFRSKDYRNSQTPARKILNHIVQSQQHHHHHIHTVRLDYRAHDSTDQDLDSWIAHFASRKIRTLSVRLVDHLALPPRLFACSTLVELSLRDCGEIPIRGVSLPALKKLQLNGVDCVDYEESRESLPVLLSGCPALEELSVEGVMCLVTSPTIASLVIDPNYDTWTYAERAAAAVRLVTPALRCLLLRCDMNDDFSAGPLESLLVAYIDLYCREPLRENSVYSRQVLAFVGKLFNVERLSLSTKPMAIPDSDFSAFTVEFRNLTELYLRADIRFIMTFLENANNLRVLKLKFRNVVDMDDRYCWMEPKQVPACLISHLKSVSIFGFGCSKEHEFEVIGYVLMNAQVLKRMKIYNRYRLDWKMKFGALKRFLLFKRGSEACELDFYLDGSGIRLSKLSRKIVNLLKSENEY